MGSELDTAGITTTSTADDSIRILYPTSRSENSRIFPVKQPGSSPTNSKNGNTIASPTPSTSSTFSINSSNFTNGTNFSNYSSSKFDNKTDPSYSLPKFANNTDLSIYPYSKFTNTNNFSNYTLPKSVNNVNTPIYRSSKSIDDVNSISSYKLTNNVNSHIFLPKFTKHNIIHPRSFTCCDRSSSAEFFMGSPRDQELSSTIQDNVPPSVRHYQKDSLFQDPSKFERSTTTGTWNWSPERECRSWGKFPIPNYSNRSPKNSQLYQNNKGNFIQLIKFAIKI